MAAPMNFWILEIMLYHRNLGIVYCVRFTSLFQCKKIASVGENQQKQFRIWRPRKSWLGTVNTPMLRNLVAWWPLAIAAVINMSGWKISLDVDIAVRFPAVAGKFYPGFPDFSRQRWLRLLWTHCRVCLSTTGGKVVRHNLPSWSESSQCCVGCRDLYTWGVPHPMAISNLMKTLWSGLWQRTAMLDICLPPTMTNTPLKICFD
jgi:hypothetical protein